MNKEYWNDEYWPYVIENNNQNNTDFISDIWLKKYEEIISNIPKNKALDLGCGIGQYTNYLSNIGFKVTSADISINALNEVKNNVKEAKTVQLDMSNPLPFNDNTFDLVFANLSIHYFDYETTIKLMSEIKRILKNNGHFIGSVNSIKNKSNFMKEIEENYFEKTGKNIRLFDKKQFDIFFKDFNLIVLNEVEISRLNNKKYIWEFISKINK